MINQPINQSTSWWSINQSAISWWPTVTDHCHKQPTTGYYDNYLSGCSVNSLHTTHSEVNPTTGVNLRPPQDTRHSLAEAGRPACKISWLAEIDGHTSPHSTHNFHSHSKFPLADEWMEFRTIDDIMVCYHTPTTLSETSILSHNPPLVELPIWRQTESSE